MDLKPPLQPPFSEIPAETLSDVEPNSGAIQRLERYLDRHTERGGSVQIVVSGNTPTAYIVRGQPAPISSPKSSANSLSFKVGTTGAVTLTKAGAGARYSDTDTTGGDAAATLTRQSKREEKRSPKPDPTHRNGLCRPVLDARSRRVRPAVALVLYRVDPWTGACGSRIVSASGLSRTRRDRYPRMPNRRA